MKQQSTSTQAGEQIVYVGVDMHRLSWKVCVRSAEREYAVFSQDPSAEQLGAYLRREFPTASYRVAYEAGYSGFWAARSLQQQRIKCMVVNAADIPTTDKDRRQKEDRRDCRKIAAALSAGLLEPIYIPKESEQDDRELLRVRSQLVKDQTRTKNRIKALLAVTGVQLPKRSEIWPWSGRFRTWLRELFDHRASARIALQSHLDQLESIAEQLRELTRQIRTLARSEQYHQRYELLLSVPGIGPITAMTVLTELVDINRFRELDHLVSYVGLAPSTRSSGQMQRSTGITPRHNSALRGVLIEAAWRAVATDAELRHCYEQLCRRMTKNRAIIKIARKLLSRVHHVLTHEQRYEAQAVVSDQQLEANHG